MYQLRLPAVPLRPYIDNYWSVRADLPPTAPLREQIFVDGRADLILNFGDSYLRSDRNADCPPVAVPRSNLDAQRGYPVSIAQTGCVHLIGVRFRPGGLAPFVRPPLHELSDQVLEMRDALGQAGAELEARLYEAEGRDQAVLLDQFFLARLHVAEAHRLVLHTAAQIVQQRGAVSIGALSTQMGYSVRTIDRLFRQYMGFSPKQYARIVRLQHALHLLSSQPTRSLAELSVVCGYYDQAHFNREFRAMTGQTPSAYRQHLAERMTAPPPNLVQFLQDGVTPGR